MTIALIHGQNHHGSSCQIGRMLAEALDGGTVREFFLPRDLEHFCLGCYKCIDDEEECPFHGEKSRIMQAVESADILVFTTPTYCLHASAPMKSFLDLTFTYWMPHRPRECMFSKKAVVVSTAAGSGAKSAAKDIADALFYWGVPYVRTYGTAVRAMNWETVSPKKKAKIGQNVARLSKSVRRARAHAGIRTRFLFGIMRMMQKGGMGSSMAEREYWERNGWLESGRPWK